MRSVEIRNGRLFYYGSAVGYTHSRPGAVTHLFRILAR